MDHPSVVTLPPARCVDRVKSFILDRGSTDAPLAPRPDPFWSALRDVGTELWLDTGDIEAASELWVKEFSALTTNNTLLNAEVQKGIYDGLASEASAILTDLAPRQRVIEAAFILNAYHGLRLVRRFGAFVSVELHTDLAHDVEATVAYGRRFREICPERFIIKVPLTPAGLIATRALRREGVPVNFTLGFSARQNFVAASFARPSYVNVFLGRLKSYLADGGLGTGDGAGERATLASQRAVAEISSDGRGEAVRQIAASMREGEQVSTLAGVDVFTMPVKVARDARATLGGLWTSRRDEAPDVDLARGVDPRSLRIDALWDVSAGVRDFASRLREDAPDRPADLVELAHDSGAGDLFPRLAAADLEAIAADGKIPKHARWSKRLAAGEVAIDTLLNLAGLASFTADQKALDDRVRRFLS